MPGGRVPGAGPGRRRPAAPEDQRPEGLARRRHRLAPAARGGRAARSLPRGPRPLRQRQGGRASRSSTSTFPPAATRPTGRPTRSSTTSSTSTSGSPRRWAAAIPKSPLVLAGDLNVAPGEFDVWSHKVMSKIVSHTPIEVAAMERLRASGAFIDIVREVTPEPDEAVLVVELSRRRLPRVEPRPAPRPPVDHAGPARRRLPPRRARRPRARHVREWERPSDHAPVSVDLAL